MARKRYTPETIIRKLREAEVLQGQGKTIAEVVKQLGMLEVAQRVVALARRVAKVDATVLITGDSGVGKERIARLEGLRAS